MKSKSKSMNPRRLAVLILDRVFRSDSYADILLDSRLRHYALSWQDQALATELVYGTLRWFGWLTWILQRTFHGDWSQVPEVIQRILEVGLYQILFLDRVPDYAAVNETVKMATEEKGTNWGRVANGMLREVIRQSNTFSPPSMDEDPVLSLSIRWSHPKWIVERWIESLGIERTESLCRANNERPQIGVRVNHLKTNRENVIEHFRRAGIEVQPSHLVDTFIRIPKGRGVVQLKSFSEGLFSIQDESAGLVSYLVDPHPGEYIIDLAAAPGGKSTHLAELGNNQAMIMALDLHPSRITKVIENYKRLGLNHLMVVLADGRCPPIRSADKVLVDAPCSGLGVIRRRGEIKWRRKPEDIPKLMSLQMALLNASALLVKSGGILVYSTCTVLREENEDVVRAFLGDHPDFTIEDAHLFVDSAVVTGEGWVETWPDRHGTDGSFSVRLKKIK